MAMTDQRREPCLSMKGGTLLLESTFVIDLVRRTDELKPPDWDALKAMSTVLTIDVSGGSSQVKDLDEIMLQLALAIKSHPNLEKLSFFQIRFEELGHLCVASSACEELALKFEKCTFDVRAAKTLGFILQSTDCVLETLSFINCDFESGAEAAIQVGLGQNTSLRVIECEVKMSTTDLMQGVSSLIGSSKNLVKAILCIQETRFWEVFRAVNSNRTLESLTFTRSTIDDSSIDAILMKCFMIPSLKELGFHRLTFATNNSFDLLVNAVSENKILDNLWFDEVVFPSGDENVPFLFPCGHLQINELGLHGSDFEFAPMLHDIVNNPFIQTLDLRFQSDTSRSLLSVENICNTFLLPNRGLSELKIDGLSSDDSARIAQALTNNTNLLSLDIGGLGSGAADFLRSLPHMTGLRKLSMDCPEKGDLYKPFFQALVDSLEQNTTLHTLSLDDVDPHEAIAQQFIPQIRYYLAINRIGRQSLMTVTVPNGIWANVLAKTSEEAAGINYILTSKPDIIAAWRRKRKGFEEDI